MDDNSNKSKSVNYLEIICTIAGAGLSSISWLIAICIVVVCTCVILVCFVKQYLLKKRIEKEINRRLRKTEDKLERKIYTEEDGNDQAEIIGEMYEMFTGRTRKKIKLDVEKKKEHTHKKIVDLKKRAAIVLCAVIIAKCVVPKAEALAQELFLALKGEVVGQNPVIEDFQKDSTPSPQPQPISEPAPELNNSENTGEWTRFQLGYPNGYPYDKEEYEELYNEILYAGVGNLNDKIKSCIALWKSSCKNASPLGTAFTKDGNSAEYYSDIEAGFYGKDAESLKSDVLDEVIDGRKELLELYPNPTLAWLLANNMQLYAINYLKQTDSAESILYFYMMSIKYAEESLAFEIDINTKYERMKYIQARYKDIRDCPLIDSETCSKAGEIYNGFQEALQ